MLGLVLMLESVEEDSAVIIPGMGWVRGMCRSGVVGGVECVESIADIITTTTKRHRRHDDDDDDNDSTTSHAQRHGLDDLDRRIGTTSPYGVPHEALKLKQERRERTGNDHWMYNFQWRPMDPPINPC